MYLEIHYGKDPVHDDENAGTSTEMGTLVRGSTTVSEDGSTVEVYINEDLENADAAATLFHEVKGHVIDITSGELSPGENVEEHAREVTSDFIHRQNVPTNLVSDDFTPPSAGGTYDDKGKI